MESVFDKYYQEYDEWYERHRFVYLSELETIKKVLPKKGTGLEIGVGTGRFAGQLGIRYGIDSSKNMLKVARQRGIDALLGYGESLPFRSDNFDYVAIITALCFVDSPYKVIEETKRVLKKGGRIIIGIIDKDSCLGKQCQGKKGEFFKQAHFFNAKELTGMLKETGFKNFFYFQSLFKPLNEIRSIEKPKKGFGKGGFVIIAAHKD